MGYPLLLGQMKKELQVTRKVFYNSRYDENVSVGSDDACGHEIELQLQNAIMELLRFIIHINTIRPLYYYCYYCYDCYY